jgi:hypothetical protein
MEVFQSFTRYWWADLSVKFLSTVRSTFKDSRCMLAPKPCLHISRLVSFSLLEFGRLGSFFVLWHQMKISELVSCKC